jgi:cytosine permease
MSSTATPEAASEHVDPDYPLSPVPATARRGLASLMVVLLGFTFFTPTMFAGADLGASFSFNELLGVVFVGSLLLGAYVAAIAVIGARTGLTTVLLSRYTLGRVGAKWADLLLGGTQVGWYAVTVGFFALITAGAFGWDSPLAIPTLIVVGSIVMGATAYYGYRGMELLSAVSVPLMTILCFWVLFRALDDASVLGGLGAFTGSGTIAWGTGITIVVGTFASGGTQVANWSRFAATPRHALLASLAAFFIANGLMLGFGAIGGLVYQTPDFADVLIAQGLIVWGVLLLLLNYWTTGDNTAYAFGVAGAELTNIASKRPFIIGGVIVATILALTGIYQQLGTYLTFLGVFIPPLGGAIIGDQLFTWRKHALPAFEDTDLPAIRVSCFLAYALGTLAAYLGNRQGLGIPPLQGILVAALAVPVLEAVMQRLGVDQRPRARSGAAVESGA